MPWVLGSERCRGQVSGVVGNGGWLVGDPWVCLFIKKKVGEGRENISFFFFLIIGVRWL